MWTSILEKYFIFICISLGIWTDQAYNSFDLPDETEIDAKKPDFAQSLGIKTTKIFF